MRLDLNRLYQEIMNLKIGLWQGKKNILYLN